MLVKISSLIDVARLVDALNASPTRATNLKHKIYYFLSLLTDTNDNYRLNDSIDGYHNLCSSELKKVLGNKDFYVIRDLLLNPSDPIIEVDNSWHNPNGGNSSGYCQGYRITPKYNTGEVVFKTLPKKLSKLAEKNTLEGNSFLNAAPDYQFLIEHLKSNHLKFDHRVYQFTYNLGMLLLEKVTDNNPFQTNLIYNLIGRWLYYIGQFESGNIWTSVSPKNHRLNSSFTNLPKQLRPFVQFNGEKLVCVDISASQPYILSSLMKSRFYYDQNTGFNLKTIYPELYNDLVSKGSIDTSTTYSINNSIRYCSNHTGINSNSYSIDVSNSSSFMWCNFLDSEEIDSLFRYIESPFYGDFYTHILDRYYTYTNSNPKHISSEERSRLKDTMMFVLFDNNQGHRNNNYHIQIFQTVFPGVEKWINNIHNIIGNRRFSYLLQRAESYLVLNVACREFHTLYPNAPLLTIHDGIFTTEKYLQKLQGFILTRLNEVTGIVAGCKTKTSQIDSKPDLRLVEEIWSKIKPIYTEEKYNKNINGVFSSNINRGSNFLKNSGKNFFEGIDLK